MPFLTSQNYTFSLVSSFLGVCGMVIPLDLVQLNVAKTDLLMEEIISILQKYFGHCRDIISRH